MPLGKRQQRLGNLTKDNTNFPKWLTPEIVHTALFIHNAPTKEDVTIRAEYCAKQIGDESMSFAMALLVLPTLMQNMQGSAEYLEWKASRKQTVH